jgi:hypothetical protein
MPFNAVVETNEHAVQLWESLGFTPVRVCTSTKSAASDITASGSPHPHQPRRGGEGRALDRRESTRLRPPCSASLLLSPQHAEG